jgi:uncharacterized protein (DUF427 family)
MYLAKASWNGVVIAESDDTIVVEGNHYFPRDSIKIEYFSDSPSQTSCPWKGTASYFDVVVDGQVNPGAAWYYADPKPAASDIRDHVAFWNGVKVRRR